MANADVGVASSAGSGRPRAPQRRHGGTARRHDRGGRRRHDRESNRSSRQASATLGATALSTARPPRVRHAGAEAVLLGSPVIVGLKGTLHEDLRTLGRHSSSRPAMRRRCTCDAPHDATWHRLRRCRAALPTTARSNHSRVSCPQHRGTRSHHDQHDRGFSPEVSGCGRWTCYVRTSVSVPFDVPTLWTTMWTDACGSGSRTIGGPGE